jgi:hypothetical protein
MAFLAAGQIEAFWRTGFLAVEHLTSVDDLERIRRRLTALFGRFHALPGRHAFDLGDEGRHRGVQQIPEINWTIRLAPELKRTRTFAAAREVAAELLAGPVEHTGFDHAILKPPHNGRATPWHQDGAYAGPGSLATTVHFWIPLHDVSLEMGCMQFIPGSHLGPMLPHHRRDHRQSAHVMEVDGIDIQHAVVCPLSAGDATVHLPRTLHHTGPNQTDEPRLAWILEFGPARPRVRCRAWFDVLGG